MEQWLDLRIVGTKDRGIPNSERIVISVLKSCDMANYFMGIGLRDERSSIMPINDNLFWFGRGMVLAGDWIFLYTGMGAPQADDVPGQDNKMYTLFWRRKKVLFSSSEVFPYLLAQGGIGLTPDYNARSMPSLFDSQERS